MLKLMKLLKAVFIIASLILSYPIEAAPYIWQGTIPSDQIKFDVITETYNQRQVAKELSAIKNPTVAEEAILEELISISIPKAHHALDQLSGEQYTNLVLTAEFANRQFIRRLFDPLRSLITSRPCPVGLCCGPDRSPIDLWASANIGKSFVTGTRNARSIRVSDYALSIGAQTPLNGCWTIGTAASYELDHVSYNVGGSGKNNICFGGVYGLYRPKGFYILGNFIFGLSCNTMRRNIRIGDVFLRARSNPRVYQGALYFEYGEDYIFNSMLIQPFFGIEGNFYNYRRLQERGASPVNLRLFSRSLNTAYSRIGVHLTSNAIPSRFSLGIDLAWLYRLTSQENNIREQFLDFGGPFTIKGLHIERNSVEANIRLSKGLGGRWEFFTEMLGESWENAFSYSFITGIRTSW